MCVPFVNNTLIADCIHHIRVDSGEVPEQALPRGAALNPPTLILETRNEREKTLKTLLIGRVWESIFGAFGGVRAFDFERLLHFLTPVSVEMIAAIFLGQLLQFICSSVETLRFAESGEMIRIDVVDQLLRFHKELIERSFEFLSEKSAALYLRARSRLFTQYVS